MDRKSESPDLTALKVSAVLVTGLALGLITGLQLQRIKAQGIGQEVASQAVQAGYAEWDVEAEDGSTPHTCLRVLEPFPGQDIMFESSIRKATSIIQCRN